MDHDVRTPDGRSVDQILKVSPHASWAVVAVDQGETHRRLRFMKLAQNLREQDMAVADVQSHVVRRIDDPRREVEAVDVAAAGTRPQVTGHSPLGEVLDR